jgi:hypothetical protein
LQRGNLIFAVTLFETLSDKEGVDDLFDEPMTYSSSTLEKVSF